MSDEVYLKDAIGARLAERGLPGSVEIRPRIPLAQRLESGERTQFILEYFGVSHARLVLDEWEISGGTVRAPLADLLADKVVRALRHELAA